SQSQSQSLSRSKSQSQSLSSHASHPQLTQSYYVYVYVYGSRVAPGCLVPPESFSTVAVAVALAVAEKMRLTPCSACLRRCRSPSAKSPALSRVALARPPPRVRVCALAIQSAKN